MISRATGGSPIRSSPTSQKLREVTVLSAERFEALKTVKDIDRALPRLVVAVFLLEEFGYSQLELVDRELGTGLIIGMGMRR
jgi:hypothetical protein